MKASLPIDSTDVSGRNGNRKWIDFFPLFSKSGKASIAVTAFRTLAAATAKHGAAAIAHNPVTRRCFLNDNYGNAADFTVEYAQVSIERLTAVFAVACAFFCAAHKYCPP